MVAQNKAMTYAGWTITALILFAIGAGSVMSITKQPAAVDGAVKQYGYPESAVVPIGVAAASSVVLYVIPQTAVLGAVLLTGYLGGAVATHVRVGEQFAPAVIVGALVWLALFLRDSRIRALLPIRTSMPPSGENR